MNTSILADTILPSHIPPDVLPILQDPEKTNTEENDSALDIPNQPFEPDKVPPLEEQEKDIPQE